MRPFKRNIKKWILIALSLITIVPMNYAKVNKADSLVKTEQLRKPCLKSATAETGTKKHPANPKTSGKDSLDMSRSFEDGFLFKQNPLSNL